MADPIPGADTSTAPGSPAQSAGAIAELYLGNILYAIERCAMSLDAEEKPVEAAFYRGVGRKLADAHRRGRS
ncbi:MAG TPA: hypothetical protein VE869_03960 [Gemmatimonas sp.]|nr:hypothetical protein [Gemmatimonas sp.]